MPCTTLRRPTNHGQASFLAQKYKLHPLEAQILASRGVTELGGTLSPLLSTELKDLHAGASRVCAGIAKKEKIVVVADYDCDGATACAVMVSGLTLLGANINFVVPDRMVHGYGISPSVVDLVRERFPKCSLLVTVDNGILGHAGIDHAHQCGIDVVVTDHHLPGASLPSACAVINPAREDCDSGLSKLAGVSVALWLVTAVKKLQIQQGLNPPALNSLLPYVAIGTVADMVALDQGNRQLVTVGIDRMRTGAAPIGVLALMAESSILPQHMTTKDIGFGLAPRLNAAGRLETMDLGIELLLTTDATKAKQLAHELSATNEARKALQKEATEDASLRVELQIEDTQRSITQASADWHPGIVGLVASRLKETHNLPVFVFSLLDGYAKGSGRSIDGFHLKDALEEVARRAPGVLAKFGGHAMAAGATLTHPDKVAEFQATFEAIAQDRIKAEMLSKTLYTDGPYQALDVVSAANLLRHPWGQGFEAPAFDDEVRVADVKPLGKDGKHWKILAQFSNGEQTPVVLFNHEAPASKSTVHLYLQPSLNTWKDTTSVQWLGRVLT